MWLTVSATDAQQVVTSHTHVLNDKGTHVQTTTIKDDKKAALVLLTDV